MDKKQDEPKAKPEEIALHFFKADYHLSKDELAKLCGVPSKTASRWLNGGLDKPGLRLLNIFCNALSEEVEEMERNGKPNDFSQILSDSEAARVTKIADTCHRRRKELQAARDRLDEEHREAARTARK